MDICEIASHNYELIKLISEIVLTDNGKTKRRIGNVVSQRVMEYLYLDSFVFHFLFFCYFSLFFLDIIS